MSRSGYDRLISVFSPEGKLYQIEYAHRSIQLCGATAISICTKDLVLVVAQKKINDHLMKDDGHYTHMYRVSPHIGVCLMGRRSDHQAVISLILKEVGEYHHRTGDGNCPVQYLSDAIANVFQFRTQHAGIRPFGISIFFFACDLKENGKYVPELYRLDPSGYVLPHIAAAIGSKEQEAYHYLEKIQKEQPWQESNDTLDQVARLALKCLTHIVQENLKTRDVEISYVIQHTSQNQAERAHEVSYVKCTSECIEQWLTQLAERD